MYRRILMISISAIALSVSLSACGTGLFGDNKAKQPAAAPAKPAEYVPQNLEPQPTGDMEVEELASPAE
jgi:outer membrane protein assembly factor BamE (lipoprotein component of BamABCDE complex)